jgi:hypothetical protein
MGIGWAPYPIEQNLLSWNLQEKGFQELLDNGNL